MTLSFPGNPYDAKNRQAMTDTDRVVNAIELLAFEVRTATMIEAAKPITNLTEEGSRHTESIMRDVVPRLGLQGVARTVTS